MPEKLPELSRARATRLTEKIRQAAEGIWQMLEEAHQGHAHRALGYTTWDEYVRAEFDMSHQQSYRLLAQAAVIGELAVAADLNPSDLQKRTRERQTEPPISSRQAAILKPKLPEVAEAVREATKGKPAPERATSARQVIEAASRPAPSPTPRETSAIDALKKVIAMDPARLVEVAGRTEALAIEKRLHAFEQDWSRATHGYQPLQRATVTPMFKGGAK